MMNRYAQATDDATPEERTPRRPTLAWAGPGEWCAVGRVAGGLVERLSREREVHRGAVAGPVRPVVWAAE